MGGFFLTLTSMGVDLPLCSRSEVFVENKFYVCMKYEIHEMLNVYMYMRE